MSANNDPDLGGRGGRKQFLLQSLAAPRPQGERAIAGLARLFPAIAAFSNTAPELCTRPRCELRALSSCRQDPSDPSDGHTAGIGSVALERALDRTAHGSELRICLTETQTLLRQ